jgi:hypothetical protein
MLATAYKKLAKVSIPHSQKHDQQFPNNRNQFAIFHNYQPRREHHQGWLLLLFTATLGIIAPRARSSR